MGKKRIIVTYDNEVYHPKEIQLNDGEIVSFMVENEEGEKKIVVRNTDLLDISVESSSLKKEDNAIRVNFELTKDEIEGMKQHGIKQIVTDIGMNISAQIFELITQREWITSEELKEDIEGKKSNIISPNDDLNNSGGIITQ